MNYLTRLIYNGYRNLIRNPKYRWWIVAASLLYLLSPIDISADIVPVIGWLDDGLVATLLVTELSQIFLSKVKANKERYKDASPADPDQGGDTTTIDVKAVSLNR
jgi:uncharacterized membrane protein YkvA (DUF1232 family)